MIVKIFLIDTFADGLFSGGRAGVAILRHPGREVFLQALATEMGLPVTAYVLPHQDEFIVRYFTPIRELDSAGYAALAVGHALFTAGLAPPDRPVYLHGRGGRTEVLYTPDGDGDLSLVRPRRRIERSPETETRLAAALRLPPGELEAVFRVDEEHLLICGRSQAGLEAFFSETALSLRASLASRLTLSAPLEISELPGYVVRVLTRDGGDAPADLPVFDLHACLAPYWAEKMGRTRLEVYHQTARACRLRAEVAAGDRVLVSGRANTILRADPAMGELTGDLPLDFIF